MEKKIIHNSLPFYLSTDNVLSAYGYILDSTAYAIARKLGFTQAKRLKDFSFQLS